MFQNTRTNIRPERGKKYLVTVCLISHQYLNNIIVA